MASTSGRADALNGVASTIVERAPNVACHRSANAAALTAAGRLVLPFPG